MELLAPLCTTLYWNFLLSFASCAGMELKAARILTASSAEAYFAISAT